MRNIIFIAMASVILLGCGGGHTCDAYRTADYTKYKGSKAKTSLTSEKIRGNKRNN